VGRSNSELADRQEERNTQMLRPKRTSSVKGARPLLTVLAAASLLVAACSGSTSPSSPAATTAPTTAPTTAATASAAATTAASAPATATAAATASCPLAAGTGPIVIGVSQALTGDKSDPGTAIQHGYQAWAKEINDAGGLLGRQVTFKTYDNQSLADTAVSQMERLATVDKVDLMFGPFSSALTIPTSAIANKYGYAFIEGAGGSPKVFERGFTNVFFVQPATADHQADPFVQYILSLPAGQRPTTAAYPQQDDPFVSATENGAQATLEAAGIKTVYTDIYPPTQTDFASIAAAVKSSGADIVLGGTIGSDSMAQTQAYSAINYQPKAVYYTSGPSTVGPFKQALGAKVEGIFSGDGWIQTSKAPGNDKFVTEYHAMFPKETDIGTESAEGYSVGQVLQAAVTATNCLDNKTIIDWLHANKVQTIQGVIGWDSVGRPNGSYLLEQYQGGNLVVVAPANDPNKTADPQYPKPTW
jgi:branched-chain amino acid transport system substrate-binding protein